MDTQSILPSSLFPQAFLKNDVDDEHSTEQNKEVIDNRQHRLQRLSELAGDTYHNDRQSEHETIGSTTEMAFQSLLRVPVIQLI